ncbi:MAG TPA: hypothetical protein VHZ04_03480 [Candidatus Paceibacterota bacterium]|jgi:hypothetical protein|nr:hypothetical protein [Candidatus Paceibacterota bacterium]
MNVSSTLSLLQALAGMLALLHGAPTAPASSTLQSAVNLATRSIQLVAQADAQIPFTVIPNDGMWPNVNDLENAAYRDASGNWVRLGPTVSLIQADTSFGDLNGDELDDAAVVVNKPDATGSPHYYLVAMLNQGGVMFDDAELSLGSTVNVTSHDITSGIITVNGQQYALFGTALSQTGGN